MRIDIMTLFPDMIRTCLAESIIGRAQLTGLVDIRAHQIRDYATDKHHTTDDKPYGGGMGMVMLSDPLARLHDALCGDAHVHTILLSASGTPYTQNIARRLYTLDRFILVCGHYEGVDQRFIDLCVDEELSMGDFVLTGGEIPAMAIADSVCRMIPGVLASEDCFTDESHWNGTLEYPQYTRPLTFRGIDVPEILLSGHHANITRWRQLKSLLKTRKVRPDLFAALELSDAQLRALDELEREQNAIDYL